MFPPSEVRENTSITEDAQTALQLIRRCSAHRSISASKSGLELVSFMFPFMSSQHPCCCLDSTSASCARPGISGPCCTQKQSCFENCEKSACWTHPAPAPAPHHRILPPQCPLNRHLPGNDQDESMQSLFPCWLRRTLESTSREEPLDTNDHITIIGNNHRKLVLDFVFLFGGGPIHAF